MRLRAILAAAGVLLVAGCASSPAVAPADDAYDVGYSVGTDKSNNITLGHYITTAMVTDFCKSGAEARYKDVTPQFRFRSGCEDALNKLPRNPR